MAKQPASASDRRQSRQVGSSIAFWLVSALLMLGAWSFLVSRAGRVQWADALVLGVMSSLVTIILERALSFTSIHRTWRYRLSFLFSIDAFLLLWALHWAVQGERLSVWLIGVGILGAFAGSLAATALNQPLWENNAPPSEIILHQVHQRHLEVIGQPHPVPLAKRAFDICLALVGLVLSSPVWILGALLIWFEDPGAILFVKNSVGLGGVNFHQLKFRSMVQGAEAASGPILASEEDSRVLAAGKFLRKTALDELPQLINILRGEMSFVGPRPQRSVLVNAYLETMPEYAERHRVLPGLAGLAQVAGHYYLTPRQKLRFDRLYILYSSLGFDLKLLWLAFLVVFWYRWQRRWNGRLPRGLIRLGSTRSKSSSPIR